MRTDALRQRSAQHLDIAGGEDAGPVHLTEQCHQVPVRKGMIQVIQVNCQEGGGAGWAGCHLSAIISHQNIAKNV